MYLIVKENIFIHIHSFIHSFMQAMPFLDFTGSLVEDHLAEKCTKTDQEKTITFVSSALDISIRQ